MNEEKFQVDGYRWIVLILYMLGNISLQILWISYAPVTLDAVAYYNVTEFEIIFLSTIFMIVYIPVTFVASWFIKKYGFRVGVGFGLLFNGVFGFLRFIVGPNYLLVLLCTILVAVSQPFILNSITLLSADWFPESERTTATGLSLISLFLGIALGMILTPILVQIFDISTMLFIYGLFSLIVGILFVILSKEKPGLSPSIKSRQDNISLIKELKLLLTNKLFWILLIIFFISLGTFSLVTTYIELIVAPRGLSSIEAGTLGGIMLIGSIVGTIILTPLSDKFHKRKIFIIISTLIAAIALPVLAFANNVSMFNVFGFLLGFGLSGAGPIILEYAADVTSPVSEANSNGILMLVGQVGGIIFIMGFERFTTPSGDYFPSLIFLSLITFIVLILTFKIKDVNKRGI